MWLFIHSIAGATEQDEAFPPPPWEAQPSHNEIAGVKHLPLQAEQLGGAVQPQPTPGGQLGGMHPQHMLGVQLTGGLQPQFGPSSQFPGIYPPMRNSQAMPMYPQQLLGGYVATSQQTMQGFQPTGYGYVQQPEAQYYDPSRLAYAYSSPNELPQRMYGLSMQDGNSYSSMTSSYQMPLSSPSYVHVSNKPLKAQDNLFGDLVSMAKTKQNKPTTSKS